MDELLDAQATGRDSDELELDAAIAALAALVARDPSEHTALELLAIDGLATAAFVSVQDAARLEKLADRACAEMMALGDEP
jgi:hypothetical protein